MGRLLSTRDVQPYTHTTASLNACPHFLHFKTETKTKNIISKHFVWLGFALDLKVTISRSKFFFIGDGFVALHVSHFFASRQPKPSHIVPDRKNEEHFVVMTRLACFHIK